MSCSRLLKEYSFDILFTANTGGTMTTDTAPKGFECIKCATFIPFTGWAYAHWHEEIFSTCPSCSTRHSLRQGNAKVVLEKKTPAQRRQDLREASAEQGHELVWCDLRTGIFHIKKGSEVRLGHLRRDAVDAGPAVAIAIRIGERLDETLGSEYYRGHQHGRV